MRIVRDAPRRREQPASVAGDVAGILEEVREGGDRAVVRLTKRFDHADLTPGELRVEPAEVDAAPGVLEPAVLDGLRTAIANVRAVVEAQLSGPVEVELPEGQRVEVSEVPVARAGVYVPAGRAACSRRRRGTSRRRARCPRGRPSR